MKRSADSTLHVQHAAPTTQALDANPQKSMSVLKKAPVNKCRLSLWLIVCAFNFYVHVLRLSRSVCECVCVSVCVCVCV